VPFIDVLLPEYDREIGTTRRVLERIPGSVFRWKPHDRSTPMGELAAHVADLPRWIAIVMTSRTVDLSSDVDPAGPRATSTAQLLSTFDDNEQAARVQLVGAADDILSEPWTLTRGKQDLFTMPRVVAMRHLVLNHLVHHRGQLTVYLRMQDIPIPALYGPSADEGSFV
jgi:uncharacterized damage-inducible protein DinB